MFDLIATPLFDFITTTLESFLITYGVNYFCNGKKIEKKNLSIGFVLISIVQSNMFLKLFDKLWMQTSMCVLLTFVIIGIIYRKTIIKAITASSVIMLTILSIIMLMQDNVYVFFVNHSQININFQYIWILSLGIRWINVILQLKYKDIMVNFYESILSEGRYLVIFLFTLNIFALLAICSFNSVYGINNEILKNILLLIFYIFLILILFYIIKISEKSNEIHKLNLKLEYNNDNLRKIKHDYGAEISYLYGLCLLERFDDLKKALKDIIEKNQFTSSVVDSESSTMLSLAIKQAVDTKDINVSIDENAKLYVIDMPEMDLFRVIFNIAHNAVEAMNGVGNIMADSYEKDNQVVIVIQNDGPQIPETMLKKIFSTGFTTKDNTQRGHGYGLSIVKELIEKYNGEISVNSTPELTEFRIVFPLQKKTK